MMYYQTDDAIFVNLYNQSKAEVVLRSQKVVIEQITAYPSSERLIIKLHPAGKFEFKVALRIPLWCQNPQVQVNGSPADGITDANQIHALNRVWQEGDEILLILPMTWRLIEGKHSQWNKVALMRRGPLVYTMSNRTNEFIDPTGIKTFFRISDDRAVRIADEFVTKHY